MAWVPILVHRLTGEGAWDLLALQSGRQVKAADAGKTLSALWRAQASLWEGAPPLPLPFKWRWQLITGGGLWLRSAKSLSLKSPPFPFILYLLPTVSCSEDLQAGWLSCVLPSLCKFVTLH